jgi:hypothetical protein
MTLDDLRFTAVLLSPKWYREAALRFLKLLGFYSLLSLGGAALLLFVRGVIGWITVPSVATLALGLMWAGIGALVFYWWLMMLIETPSAGLAYLLPPMPRFRIAKWPAFALGAGLSLILFSEMEGNIMIEIPFIRGDSGGHVFMGLLVLLGGLGSLLESSGNFRKVTIYLLQLLHIVQVEESGE